MSLKLFEMSGNWKESWREVNQGSLPGLVWGLGLGLGHGQGQGQSLGLLLSPGLGHKIRVVLS